MANNWWDNAEAGRAARYTDRSDLDDRPTLAECDADEREIAAMRRTPAAEPVRDLLAELQTAVETAKAQRRGFDAITLGLEAGPFRLVNITES